ncbi:amino acid ABC transporter substrate-binding protein [Candidatus Dependentiae bacterium]|nr:amino acid ABC transporter substrate-binding protein [Candidatus Dependentiae bacterium]
MFKKYLILIVVIFAIVLMCFFFEKNDQTIETKTLIVGTSADYKPFAFVDSKTNEFLGFDIDVAKELARRLDKQIIIKDIPFTSLIFALLSKDIDIIAAGMSPTEKRAETVLFSEQYIEPDPFMIVANPVIGEVSSIEDLIHKKVAVNTGHTAEAYMATKEGLGIDLIRLSSPADSMMALKSGAVDAFVCATSVANDMLKQDQSLQAYSKIMIPNTGDGCALALHKNNDELKKKVDQELRHMREDGTLKTLKEKWNLK